MHRSKHGALTVGICLSLPGVFLQLSCAVCVALLFLTSGCDGARRDTEESSAETITVLSPTEERVLGPVWDDTPKFLMFLPLVNYERGSYCGEPTPALAERWEHSLDYRIWTVWLREDLRWHDGVPVTADDIKFTVDLLNHPDVLALRQHDVPRIGPRPAQQIIERVVRCRHGIVIKLSGTVAAYGRGKALWRTIMRKYQGIIQASKS